VNPAQHTEYFSPGRGAHLVFVGAPGSGKSTVGSLVAERLGLPFADVDSVIEHRTGQPVAEIFADQGEPAFRALEVATTVELLRQPGVLSLGGGAVTSAEIRDALRGHRVVWLQVSVGQAARRVGLNEARPLLLGNVRGQLIKLLAARTPLYAGVASITVDTDAHDVDAVVDSIVASVTELGQNVATDAVTTIEVTAERPYQVLVGHGLLDRLPGLCGDQARRVAVIHPPTLVGLAERVVSTLAAAGLEPVRIDVPDAEGAKTAAVAANCWSVLGSAGFTRSDAVIGLGGGATTDLAGFVAATWLRGVRLVTVPTSVLGMVDAAVGGKTGINTPEGKNLVGCFYEPAGVLCDLDVLQTLPVADLVGGLAEVIKCGFIADPEILRLVQADPDGVRTAGSPVLREVIERSIQVKATVVSGDLRESTSTGSQVGRELLNYGHTLGHAIERREHYRWRHGEAVSVGMVFAAELSRLAGRLDPKVAARHAQLLQLVGLPVRYRAGVLDELLATMALDKKTRGSTLRFVVLDDIARASILEGPSRELIAAAYDSIAARPSP
jgi:3-dehydroquinate synthase